MKKMLLKIVGSQSIHTAVCLTAFVGLSVIAPAISRSSGVTGPTDAKIANKLEQQQGVKLPSASSEKGGLAPLVPSITATLADSFTDGDADSKAEPGQTVSYTVQITPSADPAGATGVAYNHSVDTHTTLLPATIRTTPLARPDSYNAIGNVRIDVNTAVTGVLNNDSDADGDTFTATASATSTNGGNVVMNANGTFTYNPPRGFEGTDTFTYTLTDSTGKTDTGLVSVVVTGVIWFIDNNAGGGGDGRLTAPYNTLAAFQAVNNGTGSNPAAGDNIFIYRQAVTDYTGPVTLLNNQRLIGQGATASILAITGLGTPSGPNQLPATSGTNPNVVTTAAATNAINLAVGASNTIRGVTLGNTTGSKIASGANFGTLTVGPASGTSDVTLTGNGQALSLTSGLLAARFAGISSINSAGAGITVNSVGGSLVSPTTTITNPTSLGISVTTGSGTFNFGVTTSTQSGGTGVSILTSSGTITFGALNITPDSGQAGLNALNNTGAITSTSGTITTINNTAISISGLSNASPTPLNVQLTSVSALASGGSPANGIVLTNTSATGSPGGFTVTGDGSTTGGVLDRDGSGGALTNTTDDAVRLTNANNVTLKQMNLNSPGDTTFPNLADNEGTTGEHGVEANGGSNIILSAILIDSPAGSGMIALNLTGTNRLNLNSLVTNIDNPATHGLYIKNSTGFNMTLFEVNDTDFTNSSSGAANINAINDGTANITIQIQNGCIFEALNSQAVTISNSGAASGIVTSLINGNTFRNGVPDSPGGVNITSENNVGVLTGGGGTHNTTVSNNLFDNIAEDGRVANTSIIRTQNSGGKLTAVVSGNTIQNINFQTGAGGRHVIGHVFEPTSFNPANFSNIRFENNTATNVTFTATNREFIFIDYRADSSGGDIKVLGNNWNMPTSASTSEAIELRFRSTVATTTDVLVDNNGQGTGAISNTGTRFFRVDVEDASIVNLTVTNNKFTNSNGTPGAAIEVRTEDDGAIAGCCANLCANITGNNLTAAGNTIVFNEAAATTMNVTQASSAAVTTANNGAAVTVTGGIAFGGPVCTLPSNAPTKEDATGGSSVAIQFIESSADKTIGPQKANITTTNAAVVAAAISQTEPVNKGATTDAYLPLSQSIVRQATGFDQSFFSLLKPTSYVRAVNSPKIVTFGQQKQKKADSKLVPQGAGGTVSRTIGDIPQNKTVTITYDVVIDDPAGVTSISTQGTVSGTNFANKVTDDPDSGTANDPTVTPIDLVDTTTSVVSSNASVTAGDLVTLTATIARTTGSAGSITGTIQFKEDGNNLGSPVAVTGSGPFTAQLQTRCLAVGSHTITAVYSGDVNFKTSTGTLVGMQSVVKPAIISVDDSFVGSGCTDLGGGLVLNRNAFQTIAGGQTGVATGGTVNVADGTYAENVTVAMDTVSLSGNVQITGNLTLSGGTFNSTSGTLSITGNFIHNGGTFNHTGGIVALIGPAAQTLGGSVQTTFNSLTINNAAGVSLAVNKTGAGILNLMNGNLNAVTFTYELIATGSITRTSGHVLGNLKKIYSGPGAFTYHVGTANGYSPMTATVTAGIGDLTVKAVQGPQPILNATKSLQRYWTLAGSGLTVNMTFSYIDPTDIMGNEAAYRVIKVDGATAVIYLDSPPTSFVDETANTINVQNISGFSDWTAGEATAPTDAKLESFNANGYDGGTLIEWRTGFEVDNLGFNLYRDEDGKRVAINSQIVAGSALIAGSGVTMRAGQSYAWWDSAASKSGAQYWLESVDLNGRSEWHGPFSSRFIGGDGPARGNSSMLGRSENAQAGLTLPVEQAASPQSLKPHQIALQSGLAGQAAVKMWVKREGFYRVTSAELVAVGLDPKADSRLLQLYADGQQIALNVISDKDGLLSAIEFYGRGVDAAFTDQRVYWLVSGSQPGLRIKQVNGAGRPADSQSFLYTAERKDRTIYFSALRNGERENFFGPVIAASPVDQSITIQHVDQSAIGTASIEIALQGVTTLPHKVSIYLNDSFVGEVLFDGQTGAVSRFNIAQSLLRSGINQVRLVAQAGPTDITLVDHIKLIYWHSFTTDDDALLFSAPGNQRVTIEGFSSAAIRVFDVTDPDTPEELGTKIEQQKTGFAVTTSSPGTGERRLLAITDDRTSKPAKLAANQPSGLRSPAHAADFVIIARREFFSAIEPLKALRSKQGLKVEIADIEDVFDEFSFGTKSPQAVKDFLLYATTSWKVRPRYVLIVGDASYDGKNYLGLGDWDHVPTRLIDTGLMETASDDSLTDFNSDGIADLAVGRLAVRTPEEASAMVRKIIGYENSEPLESMLLVADVNNGFDFETASNQLRALIPGNLRVEQINRGQVGDTTAKSLLIDAITRGQRVVNYMGHGSVNLWSGNLLTNEDVGNLTNGERLPLFVMMTCLNGYFHDPSLDSLAESLLKAENGGAVAVWTSTGMTEPGDQSVLNKQLYQLLFTGGNAMTLGEAMVRAKAATTDADIRRTWVLLGDPTMRLK